MSLRSGGDDEHVGVESTTRADNTVRILDTTPRDREQSPRTAFSTQQKLNVAAKLDDAGISVVETGSSANSRREFEAIQRVAAKTDTDVVGVTTASHGNVTGALDTGAEWADEVDP